MRIRTSCSSGASPTCQSRSFYVGRDCLTQTFYNVEGGKEKLSPVNYLQQDGGIAHPTSWHPGAPSPESCVTTCTSFLPPKNIKVRGTKHQCKSPSFLTGQLSSTAKSSLPEGLCGWRLLENFTHWEVGHVQKNTVSALVALESNQKAALLATRANQRQNQVKNQLVWTQSWS